MDRKSHRLIGEGARFRIKCRQEEGIRYSAVAFSAASSKDNEVFHGGGGGGSFRVCGAIFFRGCGKRNPRRAIKWDSILLAAQFVVVLLRLPHCEVTAAVGAAGGDGWRELERERGDVFWLV